MRTEFAKNHFLSFLRHRFVRAEKIGGGIYLETVDPAEDDAIRGVHGSFSGKNSNHSFDDHLHR